MILDLHTQNHRRAGPDARPGDEAENPDLNIGTGTMQHRDSWSPFIDRFMGDLGSASFPGCQLEVRENVKIRGGRFPEFVHQRFPSSACVFFVEVKKFFMNAWTGVADRKAARESYRRFRYATTGLLQEWTSL